MPPTPPKDCLGNELHVGDLVTIVATRPLPFRVMKVENGGIQTPKGMTPGMVVIGTNMSIQTVPGGQIVELVKLVSPGSDQIVSQILDTEN